ncbi:MAG: GAF domain-containing protein [Acidobacteria bacterium]|nr:GAF domain-containing protein [Acidobacteriota bacterium]
MEAKVLIVGDADDLAPSLTAAAIPFDLSTTWQAGLERLKAEDYVAVFADLGDLGADSCRLLDEMHGARPGMCVLATATNPPVEKVLDAMRRGIFDCLVRPFGDEKVLSALRRGIENRKLFAELSSLSRDLQERNQLLETQSHGLRQTTEEMVAIDEISRAMTSTLDLEEILQIILEGIHRVLNFDRAVLCLINKERMVEEAKLQTGSEDQDFCRQSWAIGDPGNPWMDEVLERKRTMTVDPSTDEAFAGTPIARLYPSPFVKVPMVVKGSVIGTITADNNVTRRAITREDVRRLEIFCGHAGIAIENARLYYDILKSREEVVLAHKQLVDAERLAALGAMAASINHEINNPLCAILLDTQLMLIKIPPEQEALRKRVSSIEASVKRIREVTEKVSAVKRTIMTEYQPRTNMLDLNLSSR